eukprot:366276-Chlamydomonas_euryale.AAC.7
MAGLMVCGVLPAPAADKGMHPTTKTPSHHFNLLTLTRNPVLPPTSAAMESPSPVRRLATVAARELRARLLRQGRGKARVQAGTDRGPTGCNAPLIRQRKGKARVQTGTNRAQRATTQARAATLAFVLHPCLLRWLLKCMLDCFDHVGVAVEDSEAHAWLSVRGGRAIRGSRTQAQAQTPMVEIRASSSDPDS